MKMRSYAHGGDKTYSDTFPSWLQTQHYDLLMDMNDHNSVPTTKQKHDKHFEKTKALSAQ